MSKVKMMSAKYKKKGASVPRLRFPEFQNAGEWKEKQLGACLGYQQPTAYLVSDTNYNSSFVTPVLTAGKTFILGYTNERHGIFSEGLPVIIFDDFTTATQFVDFPFKAKSSAMKILEAKKGASIKFMYEVLQTISYCTETHERHWISKFAPMPIKIPQLREQQKVADCLSSLDERIAAETNKLGALKAHKKGLLKQLFPAEGETLPQLRFPEFQDAGEWVRKKVHQIAKIYKGKGISKADISSDGKQLCIRYGELYTLYSEVILEVISKTSLPADNLFLSKVNDVIIPSSGETKIDIATSSCVMKDDVALGGDLNIIRACQNGIFISYYFNGNLKEEIAKKAQGDTVVHLYPSQIDQLDIAIPSKKEQQRIADCLSSLDELIAAQTQKINLLKDHKKGLMQQLFPRIDEVRA